MAKYSKKGYNLLTKTELDSIYEKIKEYPELKIYTDGSAWTATGVGGYSVVFVDMDNQEIHHIKGAFVKTTNNRMELFGLIIAKQIINHFVSKRINVYSDSLYSINVIIGKSGGRANLDLIEMVENLEWNVPKNRINKVKGHSGDIGNDLADKYCGESRLALEEELRTHKKTISTKELQETTGELENTIIKVVNENRELKKRIQELESLEDKKAGMKLKLLMNKITSEYHMYDTAIFKIKQYAKELNIKY